MKKIILLQIFSLIMLQLVAQTKTVKIHGVVKDTAVKSIRLTHPVDAYLSRWEDTKVDVVNGEINTSIQVPFPVEISISYGNRVFRNYYIYSDAEILIDTTGEPHLIGSPLQDEYENEFLPSFRSNNQLYDSLLSFYSRIYKEYGENIPKVVKDSALIFQEIYYTQRATLLGEYIKQHPNSYIPLWDINFFVAMSPTHRYFDFEKLLSSFSDKMQQLPFISVLKEKLRESAKMQAGQMFPKEFFKGYEQLQSKINENNQYYLIDFWYSHCGPCIARFPKLKEIYHHFHGKGFDIVSISIDKQKDKKDYLAAIKKYGLLWNHIWDMDGVNAGKFSIASFPTYILLDKNGIIINANIQNDELEAFLKKNLSSQ